MLTAARNDLLTRVGPGTPMGDLLRRYWQPIGGASELEKNPVKPIRLMGENLVLNMESHGYTVAVYNRTTRKVDEFTGGRGKGKKFVGCHSPKELVAAIKRPRKFIILVKAS